MYSDRHLHGEREPGGAAGISVPCGFAGDRLPVGLQLTGRMFDEETLLRVADAYERATEWHKQTPAARAESRLKPRQKGRL